MSRSLVFIRQAEPADAGQLVRLWSEFLRRGDVDERFVEMTQVIEGARRDPAQRFLVAEYDGALAGSVHLRLAPLTPFDPAPMVHALAPRVFPEYRRHGVGHALMEAAVSWAEESRAEALSAAVVSGSRDTNRFLARLGLGPVATLRFAPAAVVRAKLTARRVPALGAPPRQLTHVLAVRRSLRRQEAGTP